MRQRLLLLARLSIWSEDLLLSKRSAAYYTDPQAPGCWVTGWALRLSSGVVPRAASVPEADTQHSKAGCKTEGKGRAAV